MAETDKIEALEKEVTEATAPDAPKKNAVAAEPMKKVGDAEDLGPAVVKPTDSNPDATKKINQVSGDPQQKSQGSADAMPKLKEESKEDKKDGEVVKEGEMPKAALDALKKSQEKKEEAEEDKKEIKASYKKEETSEDEKEKKEEAEAEKKKDIDVKEHVDALVAGENDLSEEFKAKASTIFEAAITSKVKEIAEDMEKDFASKLEDEISKTKADLTEKVDSYLNYVVEEWMKDNELAVEKGIKGEIAEDFISGLKKLFEDHYIDVPDEKYNVLEDQASKIDELTKKLNESIDKQVELNKQVGSFKRESILAETSKDLTDTAKEKFSKLTEEIEYSNEEDFRKKVSTVKESYFGQKSESVDEIDNVAADSGIDNNVDLTKSMAAYTAAISKTKDIKISSK